MVEWSADNENSLVGVAMRINKVLRICDNCVVTNHHPFRIAGGTGSEEDVCNAFKNFGGANPEGVDL